MHHLEVQDLADLDDEVQLPWVALSDRRHSDGWRPENEMPVRRTLSSR